ncbi:hypothetical protein [Pseudomonas sp. ANT_J28]|uniref:hypothetical protein n=1 Tax=Pseudomonas sp. ANT_J28 TaxID=2597352 RepID=UPI0015B68931|nr:hypothetical protein [Pseudomonas sp. ANT_J28]
MQGREGEQTRTEHFFADGQNNLPLFIVFIAGVAKSSRVFFHERAMPVAGRCRPA